MTCTAVFVMDDLAGIKPVKDTTFALMLEAERRGFPVWVAGEADLALRGDRCEARLTRVALHDDPDHWFDVLDHAERALGAGDLVLMRSDPPVDDSYLFATMLLDRAIAQGARVVNAPPALREFNEKLSITRFAEWMPDTVVAADPARLRRFVSERERTVLKPLDGMGGRGIFVTAGDDPNLNVIVETLTSDGRRPAMGQAYLPEIEHGDKRVLVVGGEAVPWMLARIPGGGDFRGNLARGGRGEGRPITDVERRIAAHVGPVLVENGIEFAGLDIIGDRLTEINVTSPTCVRELDAQFDINIAGMLFDRLVD